MELKEIIAERLDDTSIFQHTAANAEEQREQMMEVVEKVEELISQTFTARVRTSRYTLRLIEEWRLHSKIIVAVGFDDTISPWKLNDMVSCEKVIGVVKLAREVGAYITIHTTSNKDRYEEIKKYCDSKGLIVDTINANPRELPYGNERKVYANIFLDDRAGLDEALETLEYAAYVIRGEKHKIVEQGTEF